MPSLNFDVLKLEDRKFFIPAVGDRKSEGGEGGNYPSLPPISIPILYQTRQHGKEGTMMIIKRDCPEDHPL